ncbi:Glycosyl transferase family 2 [Microbulbifer aggregans]|uniref:Glycosyl transferase family 2 n=2 Tax=Microbulbifer aggregans TaxID=1769779 RepID=A0A1C9W7U1_9GAMM|nr:Glycosyl transferase family 2 [Microbulbifer aggregans]
MCPAIIIPAHNESRVIGRLLKALSPAAINGEFEVVVSCNGCTDGTDEMVRNNYPEMRCLNVKQASKVAALNAAEESGLGFPRIYIDADIEIDLDSVRSLIDAVACSKRPLLAVPTAILKRDEASWIVRKYYSAWMKTIFYREQGFGGGVFALNKPARVKFGSFPDLIADDTYVRRTVGLKNIKVVKNSKAYARVPRTVASLLKVLSRVKLGNRQLNQTIGLCANRHSKANAYENLGFLELVIYLLINSVAQLLAWKPIDKMDSYRWQRDETSRA